VSDARTALVTGAARGQGLAIVRRLLADGYRVAATDILTAELSAALVDAPPDRLLTGTLDVTSPAGWSEVVARVAERFGGLDALVNNAGVLHRAAISREDPAAFEHAWRVNCLGPFLGIQATLPLLRAASDAAVVNTTSTAAARPFPGHIGYSSSKWAARGMSLGAAAELGRHGIRVNSVAPGPVATPMHDDETIARLGDSALLGRVGEADEIAAAVVFLLSPQASFITGAELVVDGGQLLRSPV
jgi:3alpha(or 20beta)-hydroxysteroid dehydrogenase